MSLQIVRIQKEGDASKEYILLKATEAINLNNYSIVDKTFDQEGNSSNIFRHFYRFPVQQAKKDDYVCLWTKKGSYTLEKMSNGSSPVHYFFWGSDEPVWNDANSESAEVLKVETVSKKSTDNPAPKKTPAFILRPNKLKFGGK